VRVEHSILHLLAVTILFLVPETETKNQSGSMGKLSYLSL